MALQALKRFPIRLNAKAKHLTNGGNAVSIVMTHPPSLSLETGEAQIGGFFIFR
ncbi:MAG: hypothetical protein ABSB60_19145 [Terracidiphilus sp.]|jgi:hypothetical protein